MKNLSISTLFICCFLSTFMSCKKDPSSEQGGRDQFFGTYICDETWASLPPYTYSGSNSYDMTIIASGASDDGILLQNIHDEIDVKAKVNGNSFVITEEDNPPGYVTTGTGSINGKILTIQYQIPELVISGGGGGIVYNCTVTCTKQ